MKTVYVLLEQRGGDPECVTTAGVFRDATSVALYLRHRAGDDGEVRAQDGGCYCVWDGAYETRVFYVEEHEVRE